MGMLLNTDDYFCCENCRYDKRCNQCVLIDGEEISVTRCDCFKDKEDSNDDVDCG